MIRLRDKLELGGLARRNMDDVDVVGYCGDPSNLLLFKITLTFTLVSPNTKDDHEKSKVREESDSTIPDPSHQTVMSTPPVIAPFTDVSSTKPSSLGGDTGLGDERSMTEVSVKEQMKKLVG
ncbi:hypothetical protein Tco_1093728 [Tanacetum coccineum]|uniref:Uncharacterized protein n=1 Tax=Tanacetum coccineum TaxID=301880 RepID=A0ABQ5IDJ3_9ASTR